MCPLHFASLFFKSKKRVPVKPGKKFFNSLQKVFWFSRKSNLRILHIQVLWRHQMPKYKTRNRFYLITCEVNSLLTKFRQFMSYYKRKKIIKKFRKNCNLETSSRPFCVYKELSTTSIGKWTFEASYLN